MVQQNRFPKGRYPPTNALAAAIKNLPRPGPGVPRQTVQIDVDPGPARYRVTFVARLNKALDIPAWFWGVESSSRLSSGEVGTEEFQDPD